MKVVGNSVNKVKRLVKMAEPEQVLISERVYQRLKGSLHLKEVGELHFFGLKTPIMLYQ